MIDSPPIKGIDLYSNSNGKKYGRKADEAVLLEMQQYDNVATAMQREYEREFEGLKVYAGIDNSQIPKAVKNFMLSEGRGNALESISHLGNFNICRMKIDGISGSIVKNPFDVNYVADEDEQVPLTLALQSAYLSDKELMDWMQEYLVAVTLGNLYQSLLRMYVKTRHPASPMGNIALECLPPGCSFVDPDWRTNSSKDLMNVWTWAYMTADSIKAKYNAKNEDLELEIWIKEHLGLQYEPRAIDWNKTRPTSDGNQFQVIQHDYLKWEKIDREIDPFTGTVFWEWMQDEDKIKLAEANSVDPEHIKKIQVWDYVHYIRTWTPGLTQAFFLYDGKAPWQLGRLPYFPWSTSRINGKPLPMQEQLRDAQIELNKRISTISNVAEHSITSGLRIDEMLVGGDSQRKKELEENITNPKYVLWQKTGTSRFLPNAVGPLNERSQIPNDLFGIANMMIELMDKLVPQPPAAEGRSEGQGESGILYAQKVEIAKTMQTTIMASIRQLWNDIGETYFFLAKQLYGKGPRVFRNAKGDALTRLNWPYYNPVTGEEELENNFSALSRHRVVVSEAPAGINNRLIQREVNATLAQNYAQISPNAALTFAENTIRSIDMDEIQKEQALEGIALDRERIKSETQLAIINAKAQAQQTMSMLNQSQAALGAPGGAAGGAPSGGGMLPEPAGLPSGGPVPQEALPPLPEAVESQQPVAEPGIGNAPTTYPL